MKKRKSKKNIRKRYAIVISSLFLLIILTFVGVKALFDKFILSNSTNKADNSSIINSNIKTDSSSPSTNPPKKKEVIEAKELLITAAGDCTLGTDTKFDYGSSLPAMWVKQNKDYSYFFSNVKHIFEKDDYTLVNLETPFTSSQTKANKGGGVVFNFKGPMDFSKILSSSSIEGVTISNNHIYDYGQKGFDDTITSLKDEKIDFCGEGFSILKEIKGVKVGFLGYQGWDETNKLKEKIKSDIEKLRSDGASIVIPYFHWGIENQYKPYSTQINLAHFSIDNGADLVLGSHPHVIQTIENYKNKLIVYSLGNFSFGGNVNPRDKRTFMTQLKFKLENNTLKNYDVRIIPTSISSVDYINDYKPTPMEGSKKTSLIKYLNELSPSLNGKISDDFFNLE